MTHPLRLFAIELMQRSRGFAQAFYFFLERVSAPTWPRWDVSLDSDRATLVIARNNLDPIHKEQL